MTTIRLKGGRVYDPANGVDGQVRDMTTKTVTMAANMRHMNPRGSSRCLWSCWPFPRS